MDLARRRDLVFKEIDASPPCNHARTYDMRPLTLTVRAQSGADAGDGIAGSLHR